MVQIIQTEKQQKQAEEPTRLEVLREYNKRNALNQKYQAELRNLEAGEIGEQLVLKYLEAYGAPHWKVIRNLWLDYHTTFECDMLLITDADWYTIEIKHYTGEYELKNHQWSCNGVDRAYNPVSQAKKVVINFQNIARENHELVSVKGALVFTGSHFSVEVADDVKDLDIITVNQLRNFIFEIAREERNGQKTRFDVQTFMQVLEMYETENPFPAEDLSEELGGKLQKGIVCCHCGSFNVDTKKSYVTCNCGMSEPREMAIVRTICEYGVIHFNKDLTTNELYKFCNGAFTKPTLSKYLNIYFKRIGNGKNTRYINNTRPIMTIIDRFSFKRVCKLECRNLQIFMEDKSTLTNYYKFLS